MLTRIFIHTATSSSNINLGVQSEAFTSDTVAVVLNWTYTNAQPYHRNISINVVPRSATPVFLTNNTIQLSLSYNTRYNVSAAPTPCGKDSESVYMELLYSEKYNQLSVCIQYVIYT